MAELAAQPAMMRTPASAPLSMAGRASALRQNQMTARRSTQGRQTRPVRSINPEELNPQVITLQEQQQLIRARKAQDQQHRVFDQARIAKYQQRPPIGLDERLLDTGDTSYQAAMAAMEELALQDQQLAIDDTRRIAIRRQMALKQSMINKQQDELKKKATELVKKKTKEWIWRGVGPGSTVEFEGAAAWTWFAGLGPTTTFLNIVTTIFQTAKREEFIKGPLSWLAPPGYDLKSIEFWSADAEYAVIIGIIILTVVLTLFVMLVILFGAIAGVLSILPL